MTGSTAAHLPAAFADFDREFAATRRMLAAFPDGRGDWTPHPRSRSLGLLATHVATIPLLGSEIVTAEFRDTLSRKPLAPSNDAASLLAQLDANAATLRAQLAAADPGRMGDTWSLRAGDKVILAAPRGAMFRSMVLSHITHHRAQLGVYYRLLDVPVPGMYGPSADEAAPQ